MKLLRFGPAGQEKPGILDPQGRIRSLEGVVPDIAGHVLTPEGLDALRRVDPATLPLVDEGVRLGPCVAGTGKFICIGLNYSDHAAETGATVPPEPIIFMKATSAICGPNDDVEIPRNSQKTDWEVELGVVIGRQARRIGVAQALDYVAGYTVVNDVSARDLNSRTDYPFKFDWFQGKSWDTFAPLGPWIVPAWLIADPQALNLKLTVNGEVMQQDSTAHMIWNVREQVSYLSQILTLRPGDVIATGTPTGVGMARGVFLKHGDKVEATVEGIGTLANRVVDEKR
jgi:2-keto-4-pentenoate hydratase/2-oxohepta-3-ene-1,7-dioic acid hydratase in catechol pathway